MNNEELVDAVNRINANVVALNEHIVRLSTLLSEYIEKMADALNAIQESKR